MEFQVIRKNAGTIIKDALNNRTLKDYFTRSEMDYSRGMNNVKKIELELFTRLNDTDMFIPSSVIRRVEDIEWTKDSRIGEMMGTVWDRVCFDISNEWISNCLNSKYNLRLYQVRAIRSMLSRNNATIQAATGAGKTLIIAGLLKTINEAYQVNQTSIVIVPTSHLLDETSNRLKEYGLDVNIYGDTRTIEEGKVNITMAQSMLNDLQAGKLNTNIVDFIVVDEAHHCVSNSYYNLINSFVNCKGLYGVSGTLLDRKLTDYDWGNLESFEFEKSRVIALFDDVVCEITYNDLVKEGFLSECRVFQLETNISTDKGGKNFVAVAPHTIESDERLNTLADTVEHCLTLGYDRLMVFTRVKEAGIKFLNILENKGIKTLFMTGGKKNIHRLENGELEEVGKNGLFPQFAGGAYNVLIATTVADEGVDIPTCNGIVFLAGGQSIRQVLQRIGRGLRVAEGKDHAIVIDTYDKGHSMTRKHSNTRKTIIETRLERKVKRIKDYKTIK